MKKMIVLSMLAMTSMRGNLFAQQGNFLPQQETLVPYIQTSKTDRLFDIPYPGLLQHRFVVGLKNGNHVTVRLTNKTELEKLLNLDSFLRAVAKDLAPFRDSLPDELSAKRIDYLVQHTGQIKIRIRQTRPPGTSYVLLPGGPSLLKVEQDTLVITSFSHVAQPNRPQIFTLQHPYRITIVLNDILRLEELLDGTLTTAMQQVKQQWDGLKKWSEKNNSKTNLYSFYNATDPARNQPVREPHIFKKFAFEPYVQVGLQNLNNIFVTSAGAGLQVIKRVQRSGEYRYQLFWEPYFVFDKDIAGKFKMKRNDFITFQYLLQSNIFGTNQKIEFSQNFSAGYLLHRSGNFFNETTFKFGVPGARFKFLHLHPEFIFNDLFKNFQPGLKLFLDLD